MPSEIILRDASALRAKWHKRSSIYYARNWKTLNMALENEYDLNITAYGAAGRKRMNSDTSSEAKCNLSKNKFA